MNSRLAVSLIGRGEPLTLLHGWGMDAAVFAPLCQELEARALVQSVDLPGYGASEWEPGLSFQDQAALIATRVRDGRLLGWSMGGLYALEMLRQNPTQFSELILVCSNPCFVARDDWPCAVEASVFDAFGESLNQGWHGTIKRFLALQLLGDEQARPLLRSLMKQIQTGGEPRPEALRFGLELLKSTDSRKQLSELKIPVKMIFGTRDALVPAAIGKEISKVNPRIQVEFLAGAAHAPFLSHTARFASLILP